MNLADLIARNAAFTPDKPALRFEGATLSYRAFDERIAAAAATLREGFGIGRGDRVAILAANHSYYLVLLYACARLGAMLVPINWRLAGPEQAFIIADSGARLLALQPAFAEILALLPQAAPECRAVTIGDDAIHEVPSLDAMLSDIPAGGPAKNDAGVLADPLLIVYTSGTTGRPKGAVLRQDALLANTAMSQHMHDMTSDDHVLTVLPFFHVGGLNIQTTPALHLGATVTIHARFEPDTCLAAIAEDRPTLTVLVPATMQAVIDHPGFAATDLGSLRAISTGSTQVPQQLVDAFVSRDIPVLQVYGSTETCPIAVYTRLGGDWRRPGSTGLPGLLCEARVVDDRGRECPADVAGEIVVRGPNVLTGYWRNDAATADVLRAGWFHTGDVGARDADGHFYVRDRKKNMIISGGENIYPAEIERVLLKHEAVVECAVIGRADPKWQEVPVAYVVCRGRRADAETLRAHLLRELARFKAPREFIFVDDLPRNALGKVQHFRLREQDASEHAHAHADQGANG